MGQKTNQSSTVNDQVNDIQVLVKLYRLIWKTLREHYRTKKEYKVKYNIRFKNYKNKLKHHYLNLIEK